MNVIIILQSKCKCSFDHWSLTGQPGVINIIEHTLEFYMDLLSLWEKSSCVQQNNDKACVELFDRKNFYEGEG